jgi:hypothetical protein
VHLLAVLPSGWWGDEQDVLRSEVDDIVWVLLEFLDFQPKPACVTLEIFMWLNSWDGLYFWQESDQCSFVWLEQWDEEDVGESEKLPNPISDCRDLFHDREIRLPAFGYTGEESQ